MPDEQPVPDAPTTDPKPAVSDAAALGAATPTPAGPLQPPGIDPGYSSSGVPTYESVREKIETRYTTSVGSAELDAETPEGRAIEEQYEARQRAAAERLAEIRKSMNQGDN
jgi:hypothetical protein